MAATVALPGCDSEGGDAETDTATTGAGTADDDDSGTEDPSETSETETTSADTETTDATTDSEGDSTGEETTGPPPAGLGCGDPPPCDKGEFVGSIRIETADQIEEIAGYTSMTGWLEVFDSDLTCLDFLACMETVGHDVTIFGNDFLTDVSGTDGITTLGVATADLPADEKDGTLVFSENNALEDLNGFNGLQQTQISLSISENESMTSISGFQGLVGTQRDFAVRFNPVLETIDSGGLRDILFIGGECTVTNNPELCITTIVDMCETGIKQGPFGGSTANNKDC
ncbi:MAG: hypothetical protein AAGA54_06380 [Myxococcota bacterium]